MREFSAAWPHVEVQLTEVLSDDLLPLVERGELDLSFEVLPLAEGPFEAVELLHDPYVLLVAADSPLAQTRQPPTPRELAGLPLISYRNTRESMLLEELVRGHGKQPRVVFRSDDNGAVQGMVAAGLGVALVPALAVDVRDPGVVALPFGDAVPPRVLCLVWHRDRYRSPPRAPSSIRRCACARTCQPDNCYLTVTLLARFLGLSGSRPRRMASS